MLQKIALSIVLVLFTGVFCGHAQEANVGEAIKIDTRLVSVPVIVSDRNGRYVPNLTRADFTVLQDGSPQTIEFFAATEEPLTIALMIDTSQSTRFVLDDIKDSAKSFIKMLRPKDKAMIVAVDYDTHILSPLTSDHDHLSRAVRSAEIGEFLGTQLRDAVFKTLTKTFRALTGRKAIILLTDGKDATSQISIPDLLYSLQETDTLIYSVMFKTGESGLRHILLPRRNGNRPGSSRFPSNLPPAFRLPLPNTRQNERAEQFLRKISDSTAGRFIASDDGKLKKTFESILDELRFQYRLGFYPPDETGEKTLHELKVKVARSESVVRSRTSYRVSVGRP